MRYADLMSTLAVFLALGGIGYAAITIPNNSVGTKQLKKNAVTSKKVKNRTLLKTDFKRGQLPAGAIGPVGPVGPTGATGATGPAGPATPAEIAANSLTGEHIDESALSGVNAATLGGVGLSGLAGIGRQSPASATCTDDNHGTADVCAAVSMTLPRAQRVLLIGSGNTAVADFAGGGGLSPTLVEGRCQLWADGSPVGIVRSTVIGQEAGLNTGLPYAISFVTGSLAAAAHTFELRCAEIDGDLDWNENTLSAVALAAD